MAFQNASLAAGSSSQHGKRFFTVADANRALCYVRPVVKDLIDSYHQAMTLRERIEHPSLEDQPEEIRASYEAEMDRLNGLVDELTQVGVELKDFEKGLLDFPARHEGREISLCWKYGESAVEHWHEVDAGSAGRQDVATLQAS